MAKTRKKMLEFALDMISAVDRPAQAPAIAAILKREPHADEDQTAFIKRLLDESIINGDAKDTEVKKSVAMTLPADGHTHLIYTMREDGGEAKTGYSSWTNDHSHPWILDDVGNIVIGESLGHTHGIGTISKTTPAEEATMDDKDKAAKSAEEFVKLEKRLATAEKLAALTDEHKAFYFKLDVTAQPLFLGKPEDERSTDVSAAKADDPIVFKSADGTVYRASDDQRLVSMAKQGDKDRATLATERNARRDAEYAKRAKEELKTLPGDEATHIALLKSVDEITDPALRGKVLETLKAADNGLSEVFQTRGVAGAGGTDTSPHAQIETLARKRVTETKETFEVAYGKVLETPEGAELYAKHVAENPTT
jgi:hypothetical protein